MPEMVFPDPNKPLSVGQAIFLGGILVYEKENESPVNPIIADYVVGWYYWKSKKDYCEENPTEVRGDPLVWDLFDVSARGVYVVLRPKKGSLGKFSVVPVTPIKKFMPYIKYAIFIRKVPKDFYEAVLKLGEDADLELIACKELRAPERKIEKYILEEIVGKPISEIVRSEVQAFKREIGELVKELVNEALKSFVKELGEVIKRPGAPATTAKIVPYAKLTSELMSVWGVYKVEWHDSVATIYVRVDAVDDVKKKISELGGRVLSEYTTRHLTIIDADFSGVKV